MNVKKTVSGGRMELVVEGKLDTVSSPKFEAEVLEQLDGIFDLTIDMSRLDYISSAGLRALLSIQQTLEETGGTMSVHSVPDIIREVFEITDFDKIIPIV